MRTLYHTKRNWTYTTAVILSMCLICKASNANSCMYENEKKTSPRHTVQTVQLNKTRCLQNQLQCWPRLQANNLWSNSSCLSSQEFFTQHNKIEPTRNLMRSIIWVMVSVDYWILDVMKGIGRTRRHVVRSPTVRSPNFALNFVVLRTRLKMSERYLGFTQCMVFQTFYTENWLLCALHPDSSLSLCHLANLLASLPWLVTVSLWKIVWNVRVAPVSPPSGLP